jgi:hypothetical protein
MIQDLINATDVGGTCTVPPGTYTMAMPTVLKPGITLDLTGVTLKQYPSTVRSVYSVLQVAGPGSGKNTIINGTIIGDRDGRPDDPTLGGIGYGIMIALGASGVIVRGTQISNCFGDGIIVWGGNNVELDRVISHGNRRQGLTITDSSVLWIHDSQFSNDSGSPPGDGIDLENNFETETIADVAISRCKFFGNKGSDIGLGSPGIYHNIRITPDNSFDLTTQPIWVAGGAGSLGAPWWAPLLKGIFGALPTYRWWGYPTQWYSA